MSVVPEKPPLPVLTSDSGRPTSIARVHWFRSTYFQSVVLGITAFTCPGIWGAMANVGAGGLATPKTSNAANAALFSIMTFTCLLGAPLVAKVGPKWSLFIGTLGYAPYAAGLYSNSKYGSQVGIIIGAVVCGATAGIFWATEGAIALAYPEPDRRAHRLSLWLIINQFGSIIGGAINLGLNAKGTASGGLAVNTYAVFIAIQCLGPVVVLLLSSPDKVQRHDGRKVIIASRESFWGEIKQTLRVYVSLPNLILTIVFISCQWSGGTTGTYLATYFSVRARALSSLVTAFAAQGLFYLLGWFLDNQKYSLRFRATVSGVLINTFLGVGWIWFTVNQVRFVNASAVPSFDWTSHGWGNAWFAFEFQNLAQQLLYNWLFWIISFMTNKGEDHIRYVGVMRSAECISQSLSFGVSATNVSMVNATIINLVLFAVSLPAVWKTIEYVSKRDEDGLNAVDVDSEPASETASANGELSESKGVA